MQALRHFYVLAIESRLVQTIDIDSGNLVQIPLEIEYFKDMHGPHKQLVKEEIKTPAMLENIVRLRVKDERYLPFVLSLENGNERSKSIGIFNRSHSVLTKHIEQDNLMKVPKLIFVKKRFSKLTYEEDPLGIKMYSAKPFSYLPPYELSKLMTMNFST